METRLTKTVKGSTMEAMFNNCETFSIKHFKALDLPSEEEYDENYCYKYEFVMRHPENTGANLLFENERFRIENLSEPQKPKTMAQVTLKEVTVNFRNYGNITVPKGTAITNQTAVGFDSKYNFVNEYEWIDRDYPEFANILKMDAHHYGINIPAEFVGENPIQS